jgi:Flp pilus assembly protein TadG
LHDRYRHFILNSNVISNKGAFMPTNNERGSVLVFVTLMVVLLLILVGMGLDTGQLTYTRSQGQAAVDAAALAAVSGLPLGAGEVNSRVAAFNTVNDYVGNATPANRITGSNVTYVSYNSTTGAITALPGIAGANGVRVALEQTNPYTGTGANTAIATPAFLTPLMKLFGHNAPASNNVNVSAVAALSAIPGIPIAIMEKVCVESEQNPGKIFDLLTANAIIDNSCWTTYTDKPVSAKSVKALFNASQTCSGLPNSPQLLALQTPIHLQNGVDATVYADAEDLFMNRHPGKCWILPVVPDSTKCNQSDPIQSWAKLCPTSVTKHGAHSKITGTVQCSQTLFSLDNLCFSARLVREPGKGY